MNIIYIWHDDRYRFKVLLREIPIPGCDLEIKVKDLEFHIKDKLFLLARLYEVQDELL